MIENAQKSLLNVVIPVFNEEENLKRIETEFTQFAHTANFKFSVLFVDDGSTDNSLSLMQEICDKNNLFQYISFKKNCGLSAAIKAGIDCSSTPYVGYIDADLQTNPEDFNLLMEFAPHFELVTGIRANRKDTFVKKISSKIANSFRRFMTDDGVEDTGCPLKIIKTEVAKKIPFFNGMHRFIPALILLQHGKIKQVPVRHYPRIAGVAKFHLGNRLVGPFMDTFAYRWMKKRYINYEIASSKLKN